MCSEKIGNVVSTAHVPQCLVVRHVSDILPTNKPKALQGGNWRGYTSGWHPICVNAK